MISTADASPRPSTFLVTSPNEAGHLLRVLELAQGLSARGHRVLVHSKPEAEATVKAASVDFIPYAQYTDLPDRMRAKVKARPWWKPAGMHGLSSFPAALLESGVELAEELEPILRRERVDCVVYDFFNFGAAWAAERVGIPYASAGNAGTMLTREELPLMFTALPWMRPITWNPTVAHAVANKLLPLGEARRQLGLPPLPGSTSEFVSALTSSSLHIIMAHRGFAGGIPLRNNQVFTGPTTFNVAAAPRDEAVRVEPGTVIVSTTTTGKDDGLFRRVLEAVAPMRVPVLATAASADDVPKGLGEHVRIERYLPHDQVFPKARALITHGGWGTVGRALLHGLPMLIIPLFGDQHLNAHLASRAGLAHYLPLARATPEAIRVALRALLADEAMLARAQRVSAEIKQLKTEQVAVKAIEQLVLTAEVRAAA